MNNDVQQMFANTTLHIWCNSGTKHKWYNSVWIVCNKLYRISEFEIAIRWLIYQFRRLYLRNFISNSCTYSNVRFSNYFTIVILSLSNRICPWIAVSQILDKYSVFCKTLSSPCKLTISEWLRKCLRSK